jgi:DNA-binding NarL/FixJ family response regulator
MDKKTTIVVLHPRNLLGDLIQTALKADESVHVAAYLESKLQIDRNQIPIAAEVVLIGFDWCSSLSERTQFLQRVRSLTPKAKPIIISGQLDRSAVLAAFSGGARGVLDSSISGLDHLCRCVTKVAEGQIWANQLQLNWIVDALTESNSATRFPTTALSQKQIIEWQLTPRETEIVKRLIEGVTNRKIARDLSLSENSVKHSLLHIFEKTKVSGRSELMLRVLSPSGPV